MTYHNRSNNDDTDTRINYLLYLSACGNKLDGDKGDDPYARLLRLVSAAGIAMADIDLNHQ